MSDDVGDELDVSLAAYGSILADMSSLAEFARGKMFEIFSRLTVGTEDRWGRDALRELGAILPIYTRLRRLAHEAMMREIRPFRVVGGRLDFEGKPFGMHVTAYEVEPHREGKGMTVTLRSPFGFDVRLLLDEATATKLADKIADTVIAGPGGRAAAAKEAG